VQNMVGASGLNAISWLYSVAPKDGSVIAIAAHTAPLEPLLGSGVAKFDASRFNWIGNIDHSVSICGVWYTSGIEKFDDVFTKEVLLGGTGASGPLSSAANALRNLLGAKIKLVDGYKGSASIRMATLQGEINGVCGISFSTLNAQYGQDVRDGRFKPILQFGTVESPLLPGVPPVYRYAKTDEDRQTFDLVFGAQAIGRAYAAPPDTPAPRVQALRAAFMKTMNDPAFAAELEKQQLDLNPRSGEELQDLFNSLFHSPKAVVERARAAMKSAAR
jgi:tripartite-type tricarboxylate transporter receptor subunit TctC